jgi:hypothetical protein
VPVNCIRCKSMIPQADITARLTAKDPQGSFFCARCTIDLATQMGLKIGGPQAQDPPAGPPGKTVILSRRDLEQGEEPRPGSSSRIGAVQRPTSDKPTRVGAVQRPAFDKQPRVDATQRPSSGKHPRVGSSPRVGSTTTRFGSTTRIGSETRTGAVPERRTTTSRLRATPARGGAAVPTRTTRRSAIPPPGDGEGENDEGKIPLAESEGGYADEDLDQAARPRRRNPKLIAGISVGVVVLLGAIFAFVTIRQDYERRNLELRLRPLKKAQEVVEEYIRSAPQDYDGQLKIANEYAEKAQGTSYESKAAELIARIQESRKRDYDQGKILTVLRELESRARDPKAAAGVLRELAAIKSKVNPADRHVVDQFQLVEKIAKASCALTLFQEARTQIRREPGNPDAALAKLGEALELARAGNDAQLLQDIQDENDRLSNAKYTPAFMEQVPWIDLFASEWRGQWKKSAPAALDVKAVDKEFVITGQSAPNARYGVYFIGADAGWRDVVVEMEFVIEKKKFTFLARCGRSEDAAEYVLETGDKIGLKEGQPCKMKVSVTGSQGKVEIPQLGIDVFKIPAKAGPSGGIGFALGPGEQVRVTSCKIRVLRVVKGP